MKVYPIKNDTARIRQCTLITAFFKFTKFRPSVAVISIGIAIKTENKPVDDIAIASGAPNFFRNKGTTA